MKKLRENVNKVVYMIEILNSRYEKLRLKVSKRNARS